MNGRLRSLHVSFLRSAGYFVARVISMEDGVSNPPRAKGLSGADEIPASRLQETGREQRRKAMA